MTVTVRPEAAADAEAIDRVLERAFAGAGEARLVRMLRQQAAHYLGLVAADEGGEVVGHIAFSEVTINDVPGGGATPAAVEAATLGLAPLGVLPERQRQGVGLALTRAGIAAVERRGARLLFVLGHRDYYPRFGFRPAAPAGLRYRSRDHDPSFFLLELAPGAARGKAGWVEYHRVFDLIG